MMTNAQLAAASLNDIVFDGRNKGYGAYELRRLYERHVSRALLIGSSLFALLISFPLVAAYFKEPAVTITRTIIADPILPPPTEMEKEKVLPPVTPPATTPIQPPVARIRFTPPVVAKETEATDDVPDVKALEGKKIGTETTVGADAGTILEPVEPATAPGEVGGTVEEKPYVSVEQMPELPGGGGVAAIVAAIQKAARYPRQAMSAGVEGRVYVSFVVNTQGDVVDVKVIKGLGSGLDEETVRAIKTLPRFIPGKQNGREVSVSYSVPITFKIQ